jgi:hypothetical protein
VKSEVENCKLYEHLCLSCVTIHHDVYLLQ